MAAGSKVTVYANVLPPADGPDPTGSIWLINGSSQVLAKVALSPTNPGVAAMTVTLPRGPTLLHAAYLGDTDYYGNNSNLVTVTAVSRHLQLSSHSVAFGTGPRGSAIRYVVTATDTGLDPVTFTTTAIDKPDFTVAGECQDATLPPGQTCHMIVTFDPTVTGAQTATLTLDDNSFPEPQKVSLSGTGT